MSTDRVEDPGPRPGMWLWRKSVMSDLDRALAEIGGLKGTLFCTVGTGAVVVPIEHIRGWQWQWDWVRWRLPRWGPIGAIAVRKGEQQKGTARGWNSLSHADAQKCW
jgi:hypothetical protein